MTMYTLTFSVGVAGLRDIMGHLKDDVDFKIETHGTRHEITENVKPTKSVKPRRAFKARGSKVNDTIRGALANGPQTTKLLKEALERSGFAANSLSTSLAQLQKMGEVERAAEGIYRLKGQQAEAAE